MYRQYGCGVCGHDFKDDVPEVPAEVEEADPPDGEISSGREWDFVKHIMIMVQHTFSRKVQKIVYKNPGWKAWRFVLNYILIQFFTLSHDVEFNIHTRQRLNVICQPQICKLLLHLINIDTIHSTIDIEFNLNQNTSEPVIEMSWVNQGHGPHARRWTPPPGENVFCL